MAKIIELLDSDLRGYNVRLNDGRIVSVPFGKLETLNIGDELEDPQSAPPAEPRSGVKIAQMLDVDADGHLVRLDDGRTVRIAHSAGQSAQVGDEYSEPEPAVCAACADKDQEILYLREEIATLLATFKNTENDAQKPREAATDAVDPQGRTETQQEGLDADKAPPVE